jgi:hypothetical protein
MKSVAGDLDINTLFGFARIAKGAGKLEDSVGAAFNKRGEVTPPTGSQPRAVARSEEAAADIGSRKRVR